ncbi:unnamed protein product, partial [Polarella glacialis]
ALALPALPKLTSWEPLQLQSSDVASCCSDSTQPPTGQGIESTVSNFSETHSVSSDEGNKGFDVASSTEPSLLRQSTSARRRHRRRKAGEVNVNGQTLPAAVELRSATAAYGAASVSVNQVASEELEGSDIIAMLGLTLGKSERSSSAEEILEAAWNSIGSISLAAIVDVVHSLGKSCEADETVCKLIHDVRFVALISRLSQLSDGFDKPRFTARTVWGLGKLGACNQDVAAILTQLCCFMMPPSLEGFTGQELSNTLWGLAKLASATSSRCRAPAERLALRMLSQSNRRLPALTPQCLTNSLWAVAKLGLKGKLASDFAVGCMAEMCREGRLTDFSSQGLADSLWAAARLQIEGDEAMALCRAAAKEATPERFTTFLPQELSMTVWAIAKIVSGKNSNRKNGGRKSGKGQGGCLRLLAAQGPELEEFVLACVREATFNLEQHTAQGVSNVAWAVATLELSHHDEGHLFLLEAAVKATQEIEWFAPQAVANLCWALCSLPAVSQGQEDAQNFFSAVAWQVSAKIYNFDWQDLSGILSAMSRISACRLPEVVSLAATVTSHAAAAQPSQIGTQALLNIALAAVRLGVPQEVIWPLAESIWYVFSSEGERPLNPIDHRQWCEVRAYCGFSVAGHTSHSD